MTKFWKWVLGIAVLLIVLFAAGVLIYNIWGFGPRIIVTPFDGRNGPMMRGYDEFRHPMVGPGFDNFRRPMGGRGFIPFGGFFFLGGLLRLFLPLGLLALVAFFSYRIGKKAGAATIAPAIPSRAAAPEAEPDGPPQDE